MIRKLRNLFAPDAALAPSRWTRRDRPDIPRPGAAMRLPRSGGSDDWHQGLDDVFQVMDAHLSVKRGTLDPPNPKLPSIAEALAEAEPAAPAAEAATESRADGWVQPPLTPLNEPAGPAPFVERRKSPPAQELTLEELGPAATSVSRATDQLSPEALEAIATRVAEKLRGSFATPAAGPARRLDTQPHRPEPLISIRIRRPFFRRSG